MYNLIITDDEPWITEGLSLMLDWKKLGFNVVGCASNGKEALALMEGRNIHLVLTDIRMPGMDGLALVKEIRERGQQTKVVILSGYKDFEYAKQAITYQVSGYLLKPVIKDELIRHVIEVKQQLDTESGAQIASRVHARSLLDKRLLHLSRGYASPKELEGLEAQLPYSFGRGADLRVALLEIERFREIVEHNVNDAKLYLYGLRNIVEELVDHAQAGCVYEDVEGRLGIILVNQQPEACDELLVQIQSTTHKLLKLQIRAGIGEGVRAPVDLQRSLQQAREALEQLYHDPDAADSHAHAQRSSNRLITQILAYINEHHGEELMLKSIAGTFYINPIYLGQLFKKVVGEPFNDYLNKVRIQSIKQRVLVEDAKIYDIIMSAGFRNPEYFYKQFKRYENISFAEYQQLRKHRPADQT